MDSKNIYQKSLLDLISVLPFVKTEDVVVTYKQENLRKYNEMKRTAGVPDQEKEGWWRKDHQVLPLQGAHCKSAPVSKFPNKKQSNI